MLKNIMAQRHCLQCVANNQLLAIRIFADRLINLSAIIGSLGLLFEVAAILVDVIGRAFGSPLYGSQDYETMAMVILVFGGMAACDRRGGHIAVDLLERKFSARMNHFIDILSAVLGAVAFFAIAYAIYESSKLSQMLNLSTNLINLKKAWFQWALCAFSIVTAFAMLVRAAELIISGRNIHKEHHQEMGA